MYQKNYALPKYSPGMNISAETEEHIKSIKSIELLNGSRESTVLLYIVSC
ncbi:MAG: hypothetical protein KAH95_04210 [Spirochaetales bacterium]|nr:hypothetical protein [Spirochaetales bacterium]